MPEVYDPTTHQEFEPGFTSENLDLKDLSREYIGPLNNLRKELEDNHINFAHFMHRIGKHVLIPTLEKLDYGNRPASEQGSVKQSITEMINFYRTLFDNDEEFKMFISGFLTEHAVMKALAQEAMCDVEYPTEEEDIRGKVDMWVDIGADKVLAVQVKSLQMDNLHQVAVIPIGSDIDISEKFIRPYGQYLAHAKNLEHYGGIESMYGIPEIRETLTECLDMLDYCSRFENVQAVIIILPSPRGENSQVVPETGEPVKGLGKLLSDEFKSKLPQE